MSDLAVDVTELTRMFDAFIAVDHIDLHVESGTVFGFLGPNGAGKSTTIRMLCGILRPTAGRGTVGGFGAALLPVTSCGSSTPAPCWRVRRASFFAGIRASSASAGSRGAA